MSMENTDERRLPWPIIIMLGMLALVIVLGLILSPKSEADKLWWVNLLGTTNNGILLNPPVQLVAEDIVTDEQIPWAAFEADVFKLVVVSQGDCDQTCLDMLRSVRQVHVRLNRDYEYVERGVLLAGATIDRARQVVSDFPGYSVFEPSSARLLERLRNTNIPELTAGPVLVMIDPENLAMMAYTKDHSGSGMLEDIEHLLELR